MERDDIRAKQEDLRAPLQNETVADVGYREPVTVESDASVGDAIRAMQEKAVGCVLVLEHGKLRAIFTERDVVTRVLDERGSFDAPVLELSTPAPVTTRVDEPIHVALTRMRRGGMRHLPVLDAAGRPVGTISVKRAVHFLASHYPRSVVNVAPDTARFPATREGG